MANLAKQSCEPCKSDSPTVPEADWRPLLEQLPEWEVVKEDGVPMLQRRVKLKDFVEALDLARKVGLEPSTMTGLLDRMERDALLERKPDPDDRRAYRIQLTEKGQSHRDRVLGIVARVLEGLLQGVPAEQLEAMRRTLQSVIRNAESWE